MIPKEGCFRYSKILISDFGSDRTNCWSKFISYVYNDVTSKVGDHVKIDEASPFFLVNLCQHQNKKNIMSTIMKTMIFSSFLCIFAEY